MNEVKHTPLPWGPYGEPDKRWEPTQGTLEAAPGLTIGSPANTEPICRVSGYLQPLQANADFIVKATNCHYDLLEALKAYVVWHSGPEPEYSSEASDLDPDMVELTNCLQGANAAIAKAEEKP